MTEKTRRNIAYGIIGLSVLLTVIGWLILPPVIRVHIFLFGGQMMARLPGMAIPLLIATMSAWMYRRCDGRLVQLVFALYGLLVTIITLLANGL